MKLAGEEEREKEGCVESVGAQMSQGQWGCAYCAWLQEQGKAVRRELQC